MDFKELNIDESILQGLEGMGITNMMPIQEEAIPRVLRGRNIIAESQTGTGKTAAFLVPVMDRILKNYKAKTIQCLVLSPTRELAKQIDYQIMGIGFYTRLSSVPVIGGGSPQEWDQQEKGLKNGSDIVVATPGRLLMHMNLEYVDFSKVDVLIIDEADKLLELGFKEDIEAIVNKIPKKRQTLLFSATMPEKLKELTSWVVQKADHVYVKPTQVTPRVFQTAYITEEKDKPKLLRHLATEKDMEKVIVFAGQKKNVDRVVKDLRKLGFSTEGIHSDKTQSEREEILRLFKSGQIKVLVGTDVLSRGIDIQDVDHVINFEVPNDVDSYTHRIGRTARAEKQGSAITFVSPKELKIFKKIESGVKNRIDKYDTPKEVGKTPDMPQFFAPPKKPEPDKDKKKPPKKDFKKKKSSKFDKK